MCAKHSEGAAMKRILTMVLLFAASAHAGELKLELYGDGVKGNQIRIAIYSSKAPQQFPSDVEYYRGVVSEATTDRLTVTVPDLPEGTYAVAAYVDINRNGRQDKNFLGIPEEEYGFSNDVRGMFGPPAFTAAEFEIGKTAVTKSIHLQ
jgi:uncharacterized protein (DUF2141 family)